jgi:hypothetical protein
MERQPALQMVVHGARHENAARLGKTLQSRRDVDAVAEQITVLNNYIAEIDADAKDDAALWRNAALAGSDFFLDSNRASHRVNDGAELDDEAIAHDLCDTAVVLGKQWIDDLAAEILDGSQRAGLVSLDQTRVTDDVGG